MIDINHRAAHELAKCLELFDELLAQAGVDPSERPLKTAMLMASYGIARGSEGPSEDHNYLDDSWYSGLYHETEKWYVHRYGRNVMQPGKSNGTGLVLIHATPYKVSIPLTLSEVEEPGKTAWLSFPDSVRVGENPLKWLVNPPNLDALTEDERSEVLDDVEAVVGWVRSLTIGLMTATYQDESIRQLASSIDGHLSAGVNAIISTKDTNRSLAIWDLHLAAEKALKLFVLQSAKKVPKTHDLSILYKAATDDGLPPIDHDTFAALPSDQDAIRYRYLELPLPSTNTAAKAYRAATQITQHCAVNLKRKLVINKARILIKCPPWVRLKA